MSRRVVVFNNMVTPYTNRLYNELVDRGLDLAVLSCTEQEPDRSWAGSFEVRYPHRTVPGVSFPLSRSRHTHVNFGIGPRAERAGARYPDRERVLSIHAVCCCVGSPKSEDARTDDRRLEGNDARYPLSPSGAPLVAAPLPRDRLLQ